MHDWSCHSISSQSRVPLYEKKNITLIYALGSENAAWIPYSVDYELSLFRLVRRAWRKEFEKRNGRVKSSPSDLARPFLCNARRTERITHDGLSKRGSARSPPLERRIVRQTLPNLLLLAAPNVIWTLNSGRTLGESRFQLTVASPGRWFTRRHDLSSFYCL